MKLLALIALGLVLAGCGGDDGRSAARYRKQAEEICSMAAREAAAIPPPSDSAESVAAYGKAAGAIRERETVALSELEPPDELRTPHELLVKASGAIVRSLSDLTSAAGRGDRAAAGAASAAGARAAAQARRAAGALELPSCGNPGEAR